MAAKVDFQTFDLDGQVHDLMWCGFNDETILMHTTDGTIYRSRDRGLSWKRLKNLLQKQANQVADEMQEIGGVHRMIQSPNDDQLVVFLGKFVVFSLTRIVMPVTSLISMTRILSKPYDTSVHSSRHQWYQLGF
mmetsp:Transcript_36631/g.48088  ORF Transcript_36631/g.48088 Transcript_36631/m.48088 type:complete len:134 (+) Transcript_36631:145-546(+)